MGEGKNPMKDGFYGNKILNSVKVSQVEEVLEKLKN